VSKLRIDTHCHPVGATPMGEDLGDVVKTVSDKVSLRTKYPNLYVDRITQDPIDISDALIRDMDRNGISHTLIQTDYGRATNDMVADTVKKYPDRLKGLVSMHRWTDLAVHLPNEAELPSYRARAISEIVRGVEELGFIGVGEFFPRCFTAEVNPEKIADDLKPIMDVVSTYRLPIQVQTAWTQFRHSLIYGDPIWVDEIAGAYPDVPIILTKMGRGFNGIFDNALLVALRNTNVYFDIVDTVPEHLRRAVDTIGSERIMFGSDWCCITRWISEPGNCYTKNLALLDQIGVTDSQREDIEWRTAANVFKLDLQS